MKKFKAVASKRHEKNATKKIMKQNKYESYCFKFMARNFSEALVIAEKIAKRTMVFESLKVSEV